MHDKSLIDRSLRLASYQHTYAGTVTVTWPQHKDVVVPGCGRGVAPEEQALPTAPGLAAMLSLPSRGAIGSPPCRNACSVSMAGATDGGALNVSLVEHARPT